MKANCLVTGGSGFIGSHIVDRLIQIGCNVKVIDDESAEENKQFYRNPLAKYYKLDISKDEKAMRELNEYLDKNIKVLLEKPLTKEEFNEDGRTSFYMGGKKTRKYKKRKTKRSKPLQKNKTSSNRMKQKMPRNSKKSKK